MAFGILLFQHSNKPFDTRHIARTYELTIDHEGRRGHYAQSDNFLNVGNFFQGKS